MEAAGAVVITIYYFLWLCTICMFYFIFLYAVILGRQLFADFGERHTSSSKAAISIPLKILHLKRFD